MGLKSVELRGTTTSGSANIDAAMPVHGLLFAVEWIDGDLADGVDAVLSCLTTSSGVDQTLLTLTDANDDAWYYPRTTEDGATGSALTTYTYMVLNGTLRLAITSASGAQTGGCIVWYID